MSDFETSILKFGGTSMSSPEDPAAIVENRDDITGIVVSAPSGMTDLLGLDGYAGAVLSEDEKSVLSIGSEVVGIFDAIYAPLIGSKALQQIKRHLEVELEPLSGLTEEEAEARYASLGEFANYQFFAEMIGAPAVPSLIRFDDRGTYSYTDTEGAFTEAWEEGSIGINRKFVTPGYYGVDAAGTRHLLGRGSSDRVGAIGSKQVEKKGISCLYENWTDRDGIFTANPRFVPAARPIRVLSRGEVREGAHGGAGILQGGTIADLRGSNVEVLVRNTKNPDAPGTRVVRTREVEAGEPIVAISGRDDLMEITVHDMDMADTPGYLEKRLGRLRKDGLSIQHLPSSLDLFSVTLPANTERDFEGIDSFLEYAKRRLSTEDDTIEAEPKGVVYIVGEGLRDLDRRWDAITRVLGIIANHPSLQLEDPVSNRKSPSVGFLVDPNTVDETIKALHAEIFEIA